MSKTLSKQQQDVEQIKKNTTDKMSIVVHFSYAPEKVGVNQTVSPHTVYRVSQEECEILRESVP